MTRGSIPRLKQGALTLNPSRFDFRDPTLIYATFNLVGQPVGSYEVELRDGLRTDSLPNAFTVTSTPVGTDTLSLNLIVPDSVRAGRKGKVLVEYTNTGNEAMPAPLLVLRSGDPEGDERPLLSLDHQRLTDGFWTSALPDGFSNRVPMLVEPDFAGHTARGRRAGAYGGNPVANARTVGANGDHPGHCTPSR